MNWEEMNDNIKKATIRKANETLFSRMGEWRSLTEDKEKLESIKPDIDLGKDIHFNSSLRKSDFKSLSINELLM